MRHSLGVHSIVSQGLRRRSARAVAKRRSRSALADRLIRSRHFTRDDLELVSAVAAQTAVAWKTLGARTLPAKKWRAPISRFVPE